MNKKVKVFVALLMVMTLTLGITTTAFSVTPKYKPLSEYGYTGVPDIDVKIPEEYQAGKYVTMYGRFSDTILARQL